MAGVNTCESCAKYSQINLCLGQVWRSGNAESISAVAITGIFKILTCINNKLYELSISRRLVIAEVFLKYSNYVNYRSLNYRIFLFSLPQLCITTKAKWNLYKSQNPWSNFCLFIFQWKIHWNWKPKLIFVLTSLQITIRRLFCFRATLAGILGFCLAYFAN